MGTLARAGRSNFQETNKHCGKAAGCLHLTTNKLRNVC